MFWFLAFPPNRSVCLLGFLAFSWQAPAAIAVPPDAPGIQYIGRFDAADPKKPRFDWPATALKARFTGTSLTVKLSGGRNNFNVSIDGEARPPIVLADGKDTWPVASGLAPGEHFLFLSKRTEGSGGIATFGGLVLDDGAALGQQPPRPPFRLQVMGESYAAGYGADGPSSDCGDRRPYDNADKTFGAVLARAIDAELSLQAISCIGLMHNCGDASRISREPFTFFHKRTLYGSATPPWDESRWVPDVVLVTLANNDLDGGTRPSKEEFITGYRAFLADMKARWPRAGFICMAGNYDNQDTVNSIKRLYVQEVVERERAAGNARIEFFYAVFPSAKARQGCGGHPNAATHQQVADGLAPLARKLLPATGIGVQRRAVSAERGRPGLLGPAGSGWAWDFGGGLRDARGRSGGWGQ